MGHQNSLRGEILRGKNFYTCRWDIKAKDKQITDLQNQLRESGTKSANLRQIVNRRRTGGGYGVQTSQEGTKGGTRGRGEAGRGRGAVAEAGSGRYMAGSDPEFETKRRVLCMLYNQSRCVDAACPQTHPCNRRVAKGIPCGHANPSKEHQ